MLTFAANLKPGMCVCIEGWPYIVVDSQRVKYGKAASFIQVRLRDTLSSLTRIIPLHPEKRVETADLQTRHMQFLHADGDRFVFADATSNEPVAVSGDLIGKNALRLEEGDAWTFVYLNGELFAAQPLDECGQA